MLKRIKKYFEENKKEFALSLCSMSLTANMSAYHDLLCE